MQQQMDGFQSDQKYPLSAYGNVDLPQATLQVTSPCMDTYGISTQNLPPYIRKKMYEAKSERLEVYPCSRWNSLLKKGRANRPMAEIQFSSGDHTYTLKSEDSLDRAMDPLLFGFQEN